MSGKPTVYGITADQARRIRRACERVEGLSSNSPFGPDSTVRQWQPGILRARVTTTITAGSFHSPGAGKAQIYAPDSAGVWRPEGDPVDVKNQFAGGSIVAPDAILITWVAGEWWLVAANCSDSVDETEDPAPPEEPGGDPPPEEPGGGTGAEG